jgi:adenosylcobinamide-GDP ribazoletransferase
MSSPPRIPPRIAFLAAVQFLTRVPVARAMNAPELDFREALKASLLFFPLVGVLIGLVTTSVYLAACVGWPAWIAALIAVGVEAWITGAFHEDAFADATDALGGGWTREQVLEILKDSRHGTYGVLALVLGVSLRVALISQCNWIEAWLIVPLSAGLGRWSILALMMRLEPILDRHTLARDIGAKPSLRIVLASLAAPLIAYVGFWLVFLRVGADPTSAAELISNGVAMLVSLFGAILVTLLYGNLIKRRVGGVTGDFLGSNCYLVQLSTLLIMTFSIH